MLVQLPEVRPVPQAQCDALDLFTFSDRCCPSRTNDLAFNSCRHSCVVRTRVYLHSRYEAECIKVSTRSHRDFPTVPGRAFQILPLHTAPHHLDRLKAHVFHTALGKAIETTETSIHLSCRTLPNTSTTLHRPSLPQFNHGEDNYPQGIRIGVPQAG